MKAVALALALLCAVAEIASAAQPAPRPSNVTNPDWIVAPDAELIAHYYPKLAGFLRIEGRTTLACTVSEFGMLQDCSVESETPTGLGFGAAGVEMAANFRMKPLMEDGRPVGGASLHIPLRFLPPPGDAPPLPVISPEPAPENLAIAKRIVGILTSDIAPPRFPEMEGSLRTSDTEEARLAGRVAVLAMAQTLDRLRERIALRLANSLPPQDLAVAAAFFDSPSGLTYQRALSDAIGASFKENQSLERPPVQAAHDEFCRRFACNAETASLKPE